MMPDAAANNNCEAIYNALVEAETALSAEELAHEETIEERDRYHELLDKFVDAVGGSDVHGEHSNVNCPWHRALEYIETQQWELEQANARIAALEAERDDIKADRDMRRDGELESFLNWRGIELGNECETCQGAGVYTYGSTSTWRMTAGGQMMTTGTCDKCWGSGDRHKKGIDLRKLSAQRSPEWYAMAEAAIDFMECSQQAANSVGKDYDRKRAAYLAAKGESK